MTDADDLDRAAEQAIDAADPDALVAALVAMSDRHRRRVRGPLRDRLRRRHGPPRRWREWPESVRRLELVLDLGTGGATDVRWGWWRLSQEPRARAREVRLLTDLLAARPASIHRALVAGVCDVDGAASAGWPVLRALQQRGVVTDLDEDAAAVGFVRAVRTLRTAAVEGVDRHDPPDDVLALLLREDPSLRPLLLHALGVPAALDAAHGPWPAWVAKVVDEGLVPRDEVLTVVLRTQDGDVRPSTAHLLRKTLAALSPTDRELADREQELVRILADGHPSAQAQTARWLDRLGAAAALDDPTAAVAATAGPLTGPQKGAAIAAVRMLSTLAGRADVPAAEVAAAAVLGLGHRHVDVQAAVLDLVDELVGDDPPPAVREDALLHLDVVAPAHRRRVAELARVGDLDVPGDDATGGTEPAGDGRTRAAPAVGDDVVSAAGLAARAAALPATVREALRVDDAVTAAEAGTSPPPARFEPTDPPPGAPIHPVADAAELGELLRYLLAGSGSPLDLERAIDGLARVDGRTAPSAVTSLVVRHAGDALAHGGGAGGGTVAFLLAQLAHDWASRRQPSELGHMRRTRDRGRRLLGRLRERGPLLHDLVTPPRASHDFHAQPDGGAGLAGLLGVVQGRLIESVLVSQAEPRPTLALPTDDRGWIDAEAFVGRVRALDAAGRRPGRFEAVAALLRIRDPARLDGALPPAGSTAALAAAVEGRRDADPALRRALKRGSPVGECTLAAPHQPRGLARATPWFDVPSVDDWRRDDPVGQLLVELAERESRHAASWWNSARNVLPEAERLIVAWAPLALPATPHLLAAAATRTVLVDPDADRSSTALDALLAYALDPDVPLGHPWHLLLAAALGCGNRVVGITAADVVAAAAADARLDATALAEHLGRLHAAGVVKLNRLVDRLGPVAEGSPTAAGALRRLCQTWLAGFAGRDDVPRDLHHLLELFETCCAGSGGGVDDTVARAVLDRVAVGRSKRATSATRLLALPAVAPSREPWELAAAILVRAERWAA